MPHRHKVKVTILDNEPSTGWWMVMADDEQGYAPAAHLEPLEGSPYDHLALEDAGSSRGKFGVGGGAKGCGLGEGTSKM